MNELNVIGPWDNIKSIDEAIEALTLMQAELARSKANIEVLKQRVDQVYKEKNKLEFAMDLRMDAAHKHIKYAVEMLKSLGYKESYTKHGLDEWVFHYDKVEE